MSDQETLLDKWLAVKAKIQEDIASELRINYPSQDELEEERLDSFFQVQLFSLGSGGPRITQENMIEVLSLWRFLSCFIPFSFSIYSQDDIEALPKKWAERKELLSQFLDLNKGNDLINILIKLESLPTLTFRKILWRYNIDFMSAESFFRRLEPEQKLAINQTYDDFWNQQVISEVLTRPRRPLAKRISRQDMLNSQFDRELRYSNTGAMSYNLFGADFGFNAYPKGIDDDTKVIEVSPLRFMSVKNHADDFIVNTEDGIYFWLYKTARSNYVINPNKIVRLKTHVCPGFWYTAITHLLFWAISPLWFIVMLGLLLSGALSLPWYLKLSFGLPALVTPVWLVAAAGKFTFLKLKDYFEETDLAEAVKKFYGRYGRGFRYVFAVIWWLWISASICNMAAEAYILLARYFGAVFASLALALPILAVLRLSLGSSTDEKNRGSEQKEKGFRQMAKEFNTSMIVILLLWSIRIIVYYWQPISKWLLAAGLLIYRVLTVIALAVWHYLIMFALIAWPFILTIAIMLLTVRIINKLVERAEAREYQENQTQETLTYRTYKEPSRIFQLFYRLVEFLAGAFLVGTAVLFVYLIINQLTNFNLLILFILFIGAIVFLGEWLALWDKKPETQAAASLAKQLSSYYGQSFQINRRSVLKNEWIQSLPLERRDSQAQEVMTLLLNIFTFTPKQYEFKHYFCWIKENSFRKITTAEKKLQGLEWELRETVFIKMLFHNYNFKQAMRIAEREREQAKRAQRTRKKIWSRALQVGKIIFSPLIWLGQAIWAVVKFIIWLFKKVIEFIKTFYGLHELYNKRCPYVAQHRRIEI